jgi:hypothetical protein
VGPSLSDHLTHFFAHIPKATFLQDVQLQGSVNFVLYIEKFGTEALTQYIVPMDFCHSDSLSNLFGF